jgi:hypothetical protein
MLHIFENLWLSFSISDNRPTVLGDQGNDNSSFHKPDKISR